MGFECSFQGEALGGHTFQSSSTILSVGGIRVQTASPETLSAQSLRPRLVKHAQAAGAERTERKPAKRKASLTPLEKPSHASEWSPVQELTRLQTVES